jgi:HEAT repeat protein
LDHTKNARGWPADGVAAEPLRILMTAFLGSIRPASLAGACLVFFVAALCGQTAPRASEPAQDLVAQFEKETVFWKQFEIAQKIVALGDPSVLHELEPWLQNSDMHLRGNAAFIFAKLGDERGFQVITAILGDRSGQRAVLERDDAGRPSPARQTREDRYYAAHLLGDLKDARAISILTPLLKEPDLREIVLWDLEEIGDKSAVAAIIETVKDNNSDKDTRILAINALEKLKAKEALPQLRALVNEDEKFGLNKYGRVTDAARIAIYTITNAAD